MLERLRAWSNWMEATGRRPRTVRLYTYWLLRFAAETLTDPWDVNEDALRGLPRPVAEDRFLSTDGLAGWTLTLLWATGLRVGSLVAIRPEDIRLGEATLYVREAKAGRTYTVPLSRLALAAARWLITDAETDGRECLIGVGEEAVRKWLREAALRAGVPDRVWPHLLRHSMATALARVTDPRTWQAAMGHADLSQFPRYVHTDLERVREAMERVRLSSAPGPVGG